MLSNLAQPCYQTQLSVHQNSMMHTNGWSKAGSTFTFTGNPIQYKNNCFVILALRH